MWAHRGCREENLLGVTRQRNHIRLQDSLERETAGGQDSLCGEHRRAPQLNQKSLSCVLPAFSLLPSAQPVQTGFFFSLNQDKGAAGNVICHYKRSPLSI